jgi:hypothetical protein
MLTPTSLRHGVPELFLVLSLTAAVIGLGATVASVLPSAPRPIKVPVAETGGAPQDWRALSPRAVAMAHPTSAPPTLDLPSPNAKQVVALDPAVPGPLPPSERAARSCVGQSTEAVPQDAVEGDVRCFLAQMAFAARRSTLVDPMAVPSVSALDAHLEARLDADPAPVASGNPLGKAPELQAQARRGSPK